MTFATDKTTSHIAATTLTGRMSEWIRTLLDRQRTLRALKDRSARDLRDIGLTEDDVLSARHATSAEVTDRLCRKAQLNARNW